MFGGASVTGAASQSEDRSERSAPGLVSFYKKVLPAEPTHRALRFHSPAAVSRSAADCQAPHSTQVTQQAPDSLLQLREAGQRVWRLQLPRVIQPRLQNCREKKKSFSISSSEWKHKFKTCRVSVCYRPALARSGPSWR